MTTIVERISALHRKLCEDPEYRKYIIAKNDSETVEGALFADTVMAARMLRRAAAEIGDTGLGGLKLQDIGDALNKLIGRWIDPEKLRAMKRESTEARMAYHGLDDDDMDRLKSLRNKPQ
jgi:hypothetical protein